MMQSHRRSFLSLRPRFLSTLKSNPPISRSSSSFRLNPNPISAPFSFPTSSFHRRLGLKSLIYCNSPPWTHSLSFRSTLNGVRSFATRSAEPSNRPPEETIMLAGCDWEHWLVVVETPDPNLTRDEIIDGYIKTLCHVVGSEEEARMKIYSVSTRHYYAFGALLSEELAYKLKDQPHVRWVLPDSYLDVKNKTYAGEPFINGQAVPYDPKYHETWLRNHEASLKGNFKNKKRDPSSSRPPSRSPSSASSTGSPNQNWMLTTSGKNQVPQIPSKQSKKLEHSSFSIPIVPQQNGMPSASTNQTPQTSLMQNPAPPALSHGQVPQNSQMQNYSSPWTPSSPRDFSPTMDHNRQHWGSQNHKTPVVGSQNQTGYPSQMQNPVPPAFTQSQAPQYSQVQNQSSPWTPPPSDPSATMALDRQHWGRQNHISTPVVGSQNQTGYPSQTQNPVPPAFTRSQAPQYSRVQNHSAPWNPPPSDPSATLDLNNQSWSPQNKNWTTVQGSENQVGHPSQMENPAPPPQHSATMYSNCQSWGQRKWSWSPVPSSQSQAGLPPPPDFSQRHAPEYSQMQSHWSRGAPPPSEPSATREKNCQSWSNQNHKVGHISQMQNADPTVFSRSQVPQYSEMQNHSSPWTPPPPCEPSATVNPNRQSWSNQNQNWTSVSGPEIQARHPYQLQSQTHPPSPNPSQSCEADPRYQSQAPQPPASTHNFPYDNLPPHALSRAIPSHMQSPDIHRDSIQSHLQQNGYSYGDISHDTQCGGSQSGYLSHTSQYQQYVNTFQRQQNPITTATPQEWNRQNTTPSLQNNSFPNTNMTPQAQSHQFQGTDNPRSMHISNVQYNTRQADQQVDNYQGGAMPSYTNMESMQPRDYQERDMPMDEEYMYGSK